MTSEEMFFSYRMFNPDVPDYGQCIFPSGMVEQMIQEGNGRIAVGQDVFELYNEEPPLVGEIQALEDEGGRCLCLIRIDDISINSDIDETLEIDLSNADIEETVFPDPDDPDAELKPIKFTVNEISGWIDTDEDQTIDIPSAGNGQ